MTYGSTVHQLNQYTTESSVMPYTNPPPHLGLVIFYTVTPADHGEVRNSMAVTCAGCATRAETACIIKYSRLYTVNRVPLSGVCGARVTRCVPMRRACCTYTWFRTRSIAFGPNRSTECQETSRQHTHGFGLVTGAYPAVAKSKYATVLVSSRARVCNPHKQPTVAKSKCATVLVSSRARVCNPLTQTLARV